MSVVSGEEKEERTIISSFVLTLLCECSLLWPDKLTHVPLLVEFEVVFLWLDSDITQSMFTFVQVMKHQS